MGKLVQKKPKVKKILEPRNYEGIKCYTLLDIKKMLSKNEMLEFCNWIAGQTGILVEGNPAYYAWDVIRFIEKVRTGKETYFD